MDSANAIAATKDWIATVVIRLNLCPFARRPFEADAIRYTVSDATDTESLMNDLALELKLLNATPRTEVETAILIHPQILIDFRDYNDFLGVAEVILENMQLYGVIQIASFHPDYQFANTDIDDIVNYTNRSPFPMLHLLREASVSEVNADPERVQEIPQRNIDLLRKLGIQAIPERFRRD